MTSDRGHPWPKRKTRSCLAAFVLRKRLTREHGASSPCAEREPCRTLFLARESGNTQHAPLARQPSPPWLGSLGRQNVEPFRDRGKGADRLLRPRPLGGQLGVPRFESLFQSLILALQGLDMAL